MIDGSSQHTGISQMLTKKPLRIGIWCAYHITLEQSEGIGVFAHNLARGLANQSSDVEITMMVLPGDEHVMDQTVALGRGRIKVASVPKLSFVQRKAKKFSWKIFQRGYYAEQILRRTIDRAIHKIDQNPRQDLRKSCQVVKRDIAKGGMKIVQSLMRKSNRVFTRLDQLQDREKERIIDSCDVWLIPYVGLPQTFSKPTVVTIHDLVCYHFPNMLSPNELAVFKNLAESVAAKSTIAACMSNFIRDNDLFGVLGLSPAKVRVVQPAAPTDFGELGDVTTAQSLYPVLREKYIFYPSAFRGYKNHELLVDALALMNQQGCRDLHLVFTGIHDASSQLKARIEASGVEDRIHVLGKVDRKVLSAIYHKAWLTAVPSFYEQGSFPLMEAMYWGCPIAASNIASLVELFEPLGNCMRFFNPHDVHDLIRVLREFEANRQQILDQQQASRDRIFGRTWTDAAVDWIQVFQDAIALDQAESACDAKNSCAA